MLKDMQYMESHVLQSLFTTQQKQLMMKSSNGFPSNLAESIGECMRGL